MKLAIPVYLDHAVVDKIELDAGSCRTVVVLLSYCCRTVDVFSRGTRTLTRTLCCCAVHTHAAIHVCVSRVDHAPDPWCDLVYDHTILVSAEVWAEGDICTRCCCCAVHTLLYTCVFHGLTTPQPRTHDKCVR